MFKDLRVLLLAIGALWSGVALSGEIPPAIRAFLLERNRMDLVSRFEAIPVLKPEEFTQRFLMNGKIKPVGAGYNGIAFQNVLGRVGKLNYRVLAAFNIVELADHTRQITPDEREALRKGWSAFITDSGVLRIDIPKLRGRPSEPLGSQPIKDELLGTLLWSAYNPEFTPYPSMISKDGLSFESDFVPGVTFLDILKSQRENTPLHRDYDIQKIWKKVVYYQYLAEIMLLDSGVTIDLFMPGNIIVGGTYEDPEVRLVDHAIAKPSPEAYAVYEKRGWQVPKPAFEHELKLIVWPTMAEHIVSSMLWNLNFYQAVEYIKTRYQLSSDLEAIERLAQVEKWQILEAPHLQNYQNIEKAQAIVCSKHINEQM